MTEAVLLGLLLLALAGWSAFVVLICRALLPMVNAFKVSHQIDAHFDKRINDVLDRARANTKKPVVPDGKPSSQAAQIQEELRNVFGPPLIPTAILDEQPDADGIEVVQA